MVAQKTGLVLVSEQIKQAFAGLFEQEHIGPDFYRVYTRPSAVPDEYDVVLVWDGFEPMSVTGRQVWIWERIRKAVPDEVRKNLGKVLAHSAKEVIVADEISSRERDVFVS